MRLNRSRLGKTCLAGRVMVPLALLLAVAAGVLFIAPKLRIARDMGSNRFFTSKPGSLQHQVHPALVAYGRLPLMFEPNQGQTNPQVKFLAHGSGYGLFLTANEAVLTLPHPADQAKPSAPRMSVLRMSMVGSSASAQVSGAEELPGHSNYFIGNDPTRWRTGVPHFARVSYRGVYPGIDLVYYGKQGQLEYDFEVAPGSDPRQVALKFQGSRKLNIDGNGDLLIDADGSQVQLQAPHVYQKVGTEERSVAGRFSLVGTNRDEVRFELGDYDRSQTLIIDPVLVYSHLFGGSGLESCSAILGQSTPITPGCPAIAVDAVSNAYIAGSTTSSDLPMTTGEFQSAFVSGAMANAYVAKFDVNGVLIWATYLGGHKLDYTTGIAVDNGQNVTVAGTTSSIDFPTHNGFQSGPASVNNHVFVSQLNSTGRTLLYSTYLSGNGADLASGLALDPNGIAYVTGSTGSSNFPTTVGAYQTTAKAASQAFFSRVDTAASGSASLLYSTYIGGSSPSTGVVIGGGIAVDSNANAYITGGTNFIDFPALNAYQGTLKNTGGGTNAFVTKINPAGVTGAQLLYSTYFGGTGNLVTHEGDVAYGIAVDSSTDAYITGSTTSSDIVIPTGTTPFLQCLDQPLDPTPCLPVNNPPTDAFLAKFGTLCTGTTCTVTTLPLNYFTYLGGTGDDRGMAVAVDTNQGARITGWTASTDFPIVKPVQSAYGGAVDAFVARIDTLATCSPITAPMTCPATSNSTYLGGSALDAGTSIAVDGQGSSFVTGETASPNFPGGPANASDAFISKLGPSLALLMPQPTVNGSATPTPIGVGGQATFVYTITNTGDFTNGVTFTDILPATGSTFGTVTASPGNCGQPSGSPPTLICNIGALNTAGTATITITTTPVAPPVPGGSLLLGNSGTANVNGLQLASSSNSVVVNDFSVQASPASATVPAGVPATYTITATPSANTGFPGSVSLTCSTALPTGVTCTAGNNNPIPNLNSGPQSAQLIINTTARVTTTTELRHGLPIYALWLPVSGLTLLGAGLGRKPSARRRFLMAALFACFFALTLFQAACGSSKHTSTTTGTPAGTYPITISATSGSGAVRTALVTLVVQ